MSKCEERLNEFKIWIIGERGWCRRTNYGVLWPLLKSCILAVRLNGFT